MLDLRVTLYEPAVTVNASGQATKGWSSAGAFYAERVVNETAGTEAMPYDQMMSSAIYIWRLRYPNTVKANWKLEYNSEDYDILSVVPEGRRRFIIVKTRLRDNGTR
jgi:SPP1 family predicted phage head-tail adaptor